MRGTSLRLALLALTVAGGCTKPRTELVIGMMTDLSARDMIDTVMLTAEREGVLLFTQQWNISGVISQRDELPGSFGVFSSDGSEPRITVTATAFNNGGATAVVQRTSVTSLVYGQTLFLRLALVSGCTTMACPAGATCVEGVCKAQQVNPLTFPVYKKDKEKSLDCNSGPMYRNTSTKQLMTVVGKGDCSADEDCQEGTCYKRLGPTTGTRGDMGGGIPVVDQGMGASCDPVMQTGCPTGEKCYVSSAGTFLCKSVGTKGIGEACTAGIADDCQAGLHCAADGTPPVCRQYCNADTDCKQSPAMSAGTAEPTNLPRCFEGLTASSVKLCSISCDPIGAGAGCATGRDCGFFTNMANNEYTDCYVSGGITDGNVCTRVGDCAAGETCAQSGTGTAHCRPTCRPMTGDCTAAMGQCPPLGGVTNPIFSACCPATGC